jgi:D-sedoheptulose 7-phosphate isomerase
MDLCAAILRKSRESATLKERFVVEHAARIAECASAMADAFDRDGRLFTMGNGGSACDAAHAAVEFMHPVVGKRPPLPAMALGEPALTTAIGNDDDFAAVFVRPLSMLAKPGDIALGISTSGMSSSVNRALQAAREIGLLTVGLTGKDGGRMIALCDFAFVVPSFSVHRIQETHEMLLHLLWDVVHVVRGQEDVL